MKPDQERVRGLLTDTVTLLCKNGLQYSKELKVQGLLGITLDNDDVFVVHINEIFDGLVGGQVTAIQPGDSINSAIVAADSATQPTEREQITVKSRKSTPHKHGVPRTSSPMTLHGSSKRKASLKPPQMRIKKEEDDDDVVLLDNAKSEPNHTSEFVPTATDLSGDGDREAMRMSYGGATLSELDQDSPPAKRRAGESVNKSGDAFTEQSESGAPFITGIVHNNTDADILGNTSSLDGSQLSGVGQMEGQVGFDNAPGCSAWDASQVADGNGEDPTDPGSQDSMISQSPIVMNLIQSGLLMTPEDYDPTANNDPEPLNLNLNDVQKQRSNQQRHPAMRNQHHRRNEPQLITQPIPMSVHRNNNNNIPGMIKKSPAKNQAVFQASAGYHPQQKKPMPFPPGYVSGCLGKRYRPKNSPDKQFKCDFPGCSLTFYEKRTLIRHIRMKHQQH